MGLAKSIVETDPTEARMGEGAKRAGGGIGAVAAG